MSVDLDCCCAGFELTSGSGFGHDKSLAIRPYRHLPADQRPTMFYAGDGVSDLSAASETDLLFAKKGQGMLEGDSPLLIGSEVCDRFDKVLC